jgi:hypothetical protein
LDAGFGEVSVFHGEDAVGDVQDAAVVRDEEDGAASVAGEFLQELDDFAPGLTVERGGRFIGEDQLGSGGEGAGDGDALLLSPRKAAGEVVEPVAEAHALEQVGGAVAGLAGRDLGVELEHQLDVLAGGEELEQVVLLEDEADVAAGGEEYVVGGVGEVAAQDGERAFADDAKSADQGEEGRLAAAGGAGEEHDLAWGDGEGDVKEDLLAEIAFAKGKVDAVGVDDVGHGIAAGREPPRHEGTKGGGRGSNWGGSVYTKTRRKGEEGNHQGTKAPREVVRRRTREALSHEGTKKTLTHHRTKPYEVLPSLLDLMVLPPAFPLCL